MLALYFGNDRTKVLKEAEKALGKEALTPELYDELSVDLRELLSFAEHASLFGEKKVFRLMDVLTREDIEEAILSNVGRFVKSENSFFLLEHSLLADQKKKLEKGGAQLFEHKSLEKKKKVFNVFALSDALVRRDKKLLWVLLTKAFKEGKSAEELIGTLFWQLKSLVLVEQGGGSTLSLYVVSKAKQGLRNFKTGELCGMTKRLLIGYHEARRGRGDMEIMLERFVLSL